MKFAVQITPEAERNLIAAFDYIFERSQRNAEAWLHGAYEKIAKLELFPNRCGAAREQRYLPDRKLRQVIYKSHRIIFEIDEDQWTVRVVYVRHGRMRAVGEAGSDDMES